MLQHTMLLLELVYFLWFEQKELARGAQVLIRVRSTPACMHGQAHSASKLVHRNTVLSISCRRQLIAPVRT